MLCPPGSHRREDCWGDGSGGSSQGRGLSLSTRLASPLTWEAVSSQARLCVAPSFCRHACLCLLQWACGGDRRPLQLPEQDRKLSLGRMSCQGMLAGDRGWVGRVGGLGSPSLCPPSSTHGGKWPPPTARGGVCVCHWLCSEAHLPGGVLSQSGPSPAG